jgi:hypothetical protein
VSGSVWILIISGSWVRILIRDSQQSRKLDPDPHQSEKSYPDPHYSEKLNPVPWIRYIGFSTYFCLTRHYFYIFSVKTLSPPLTLCCVQEPWLLGRGLLDRTQPGFTHSLRLARRFVEKDFSFSSVVDPWHFGTDPDTRIPISGQWILLFSSLTFKIETIVDPQDVGLCLLRSFIFSPCAY